MIDISKVTQTAGGDPVYLVPQPVEDKYGTAWIFGAVRTKLNVLIPTRWKDDGVCITCQSEMNLVEGDPLVERAARAICRALHHSDENWALYLAEAEAAVEAVQEKSDD